MTESRESSVGNGSFLNDTSAKLSCKDTASKWRLMLVETSMGEEAGTVVAIRQS